MRSRPQRETPNPKRETPLLPFVFVNMAMTADGKIATANRAVATFSSPRDHDHLYELRATADAVMSGARTVDLNNYTLSVGADRYRKLRLRRGLAEYALRVIVSGSGSVRPDAEIFRHRFSSILVLTSERAPAAALKKLRTVVDAVRVTGKDEVDFTDALAWLRKEWKVQRLLCEGGGELNDALFRAGLVDELHLTLCPRLIGGRNAPTIADGVGFAHLSDAFQLRLASTKRIGDELFCVFQRSA
ncbi:MAG: 2,5-diamino-6-(ribosylamino)-4(3H)-pyrimidinone 5'-phosphate reductase [Proteobacteria bacterium]|nr:2,5-diamino-6-(ribosylamino)-4(3H)-pyrimidinone 5'-phosphate reductase [Pseudomonadota bacterium]